MSSYLNIFLKKRDTKEYLLLDSHCRSSEIYQRAWENINPVYGGMEYKYSDLKVKDISLIINDIAKDKANIDRQIKLYDKYLKQVVDFIDPAIPDAPKPKKAIGGDKTIEECITTLSFLKQEYAELNNAMDYANFLHDLQQTCENECNAFECIAMNIT